MTAHKSPQTIPPNLLIATYPSNPINNLFHPIPPYNKDPHFTICHYTTHVFSCGHSRDCLRHLQPLPRRPIRLHSHHHPFPAEPVAAASCCSMEVLPLAEMFRGNENTGRVLGGEEGQNSEHRPRRLPFPFLAGGRRCPELAQVG